MNPESPKLYLPEPRHVNPLKLLSPGALQARFMFQESLNRELGPVIQRYSEGKATLVFCVTKRPGINISPFLKGSRY